MKQSPPTAVNALLPEREIEGIGMVTLDPAGFYMHILRLAQAISRRFRNLLKVEPVSTGSGTHFRNLLAGIGFGERCRRDWNIKKLTKWAPAFSYVKHQKSLLGHGLHDLVTMALELRNHEIVIVGVRAKAPVRDFLEEFLQRKFLQWAVEVCRPLWRWCENLN